ncbi:hypothetical protein KGM_212396A, partial [Danaus plexippus plexippus]
MPLLSQSLQNQELRTP